MPYLYHPNTDLFYIAGISEQGSLLLVEKGNQPQALYTLFVARRDPTRELWDGPLCGDGDEVRDFFGVDHVRTTDELSSYIAQALPAVESFHFDADVNQSLSVLFGKLDTSHQKRLVSKWDRESPPKAFLLPQRLIKSPAEQALMRKSSSIMSHSLNAAMAHTTLSAPSNSVEEKHIEAAIEFHCKKRGASRLAFPSVVASGPNGTILHYMSNDRSATAGDFVMIDAGCELHGYCSDVSRSWPVSGRFSGPQKDFYQLVLSVQKKCIALATEDALLRSEPVSLDMLHLLAVRELTDGLLQLGFLRGHSMQSAISTGAYASYFPHATGHYLGLDVHDTHQVPKSTSLRRGMVVTVEPGLYCPADDMSAPPAFRGLGMRIEDDVLVGGAGTGVEVLSEGAVKEIEDVEALVGSGR